jgi:hypothetical protein
MAMYRARLTGLPDERGDGVATERIGNQQMAPITVQAAFALGIGQEIGLPGHFIESRSYAKREFRRRRIETTGLIEGMGEPRERRFCNKGRGHGEARQAGEIRQKEAERSGKLSFFYTGLQVEKVSI